MPDKTLSLKEVKVLVNETVSSPHIAIDYKRHFGFMSRFIACFFPANGLQEFNLYEWQVNLHSNLGASHWSPRFLAMANYVYGLLQAAWTTTIRGTLARNKYH